MQIMKKRSLNSSFTNEMKVSECTTKLGCFEIIVEEYLCLELQNARNTDGTVSIL